MSTKKVISQAPGRINIIGEHTDYNDGLVFPAAIDRAVTFTTTINGSDSKVNLGCADNGESIEFDLLSMKPSIEHPWANYLMAVLEQLKEKTQKIKGFNASFQGNVPIGSGVSSSAALECSFAVGLNALFDLKLDKWDLIKASQLAEHSDYVGTKCGIMDQFASIMGKENHAMLLDCNSLNYEYVPIHLGENLFLLINSHVKHSLAESEYNIRRQECEKALALIKLKFKSIQNFRDVTYDILNTVEKELPPKLFNRTKHIISENHRVLKAKNAMKNGNFKKLGELIYASHNSLSDDFEVSCSELDYLVDLSKKNDSVLGSRMMGGGFGGCTINLIKKDAIEEFTKMVEMAYTDKYKIKPSFYQFEISDGAKILE